MTPKNEAQLIEEVSRWAEQNFATCRAPALGVIEEIGEATHCVLKKFQKIRGFNRLDYFEKHFTDALADCVIYLCDWCALHKAFFNFGRNQHQLETLTFDDEHTIIVHLLQGSAAMLALDLNVMEDTAMQAAANAMAQRICTGLECWATLYKIDLPLAVSATWSEVSKRDWVKNPVTAGN